MNLQFRNEQPTDAEAIFEVTRLAFLSAAHTSHTEQFIVNALRRIGHLALSLVAVADETLIGHVAFSPLALPNGETGWYGVGPLSVLPQFQRQGIGSQLMQRGMAALKDTGARGCVLVGAPRFYGRLGISQCTGLTLNGVPPEYLLGKSFGGDLPKGEVVFSLAFAATV